MRRFLLTLALGAGTAAGLRAEVPPPLDTALRTLNAVGPEGRDSESAPAAWKVVSKSKPEHLGAILAAFDAATPVGANYLRSAVDALVEKAKADKAKLPVEELVAFAKETKHNGTARKLAHGLLEDADPATYKSLIPTFLNDPQPDLRRLAVESALAEAKPLKGDSAIAAYKAALKAARDEDQVGEIAKALKDLGTPIDLTKHFNFITEWHISPPFDNKDEAGFAKVYDPESKADRTGWTYARAAAGGTVDLNKAVAKKKELVAYASATIVVEADLDCEVRASTQNAIKIFVNGKEVYFREEYHHGQYLDQHNAKVTLKKGKNEILLKICQNALAQSWSEPWGFVCQLSDRTGAAVAVKQSIAKDGKDQLVDLGAIAPASEPKKEGK